MVYDHCLVTVTMHHMPVKLWIHLHPQDVGIGFNNLNCKSLEDAVLLFITFKRANCLFSALM